MLLLLSLAALPFSNGYGAEPSFDIDIPAMNAAEALNRLAEQTGSVMLFPYDLARARQAKAVRGRYTLQEGLERLLRGTGLTGGLSEKRVVIIVEGHKSPDDAGGKVKKSGVIAGFVTAVLGHAATDAQADQDAARSASTQLSEIVVTAQKRAENLQDVPLSISVLGGDRLDLSTTQGVSEELTRVPGVATFAHAQAGGTMVSVRGAAAGGPTYAGSSPVSYYLDSASFGLVQTAILPDANAYDLERIEVVRGPQGTLYGANAQAGVVRIITRDADLDEFDAKVRASDSYTDGGGNNYRADVALNAPLIEDKLAARLVVGYQDLSGWIDTPIRAEANDAELTSVRLKINSQLNDRFSLGASVWLARNDFGGLSASDDDGNRNALFDESYDMDYDVYGLTAIYQARSFVFTSMTSYLTYENGGAVDALGLLGAHIPLFVSFDADVLAEEINLASTHDGPWRWTAGAMFRDARDINYAEIVPAIFILDWTNTSKAYAVFGEVSRLFYDDKLEWTVGARYFHDRVTSKEDELLPPINPPDYYKVSDTFTSTTPRVVLTWRPNSNLSVYGSYSEGYRSGTPQSYYTVGGQPGFPSAKPDTLNNFEVGAKGGTTRLSFEAAVYYMDWQDMQQQITVLFNGAPVSAIVNAESASGYGVDFGVTARPTDEFEFGATVSWNDLAMDSEIVSQGVVIFEPGDRPNFSPEYTASLFAGYEFPIGGDGATGKFSVSGNYTSEQGFSAYNNGARVSAFGDELMVTRASFAIRTARHWEISLFGDNLNDEDGTVVGNPFFGPDYDARIRPRTFGLQVDYRM